MQKTFGLYVKEVDRKLAENVIRDRCGGFEWRFNPSFCEHVSGGREIAAQSEGTIMEG